MNILSHTVIVESPFPKDEAIQFCKDYIYAMGWTRDDVSLRFDDEKAYVVAKREIEI